VYKVLTLHDHRGWGPQFCAGAGHSAWNTGPIYENKHECQQSETSNQLRILPDVPHLAAAKLATTACGSRTKRQNCNMALKPPCHPPIIQQPAVVWWHGTAVQTSGSLSGSSCKTYLFSYRSFQGSSQAYTASVCRFLSLLNTHCHLVLRQPCIPLSSCNLDATIILYELVAHIQEVRKEYQH